MDEQTEKTIERIEVCVARMSVDLQHAREDVAEIKGRLSGYLYATSGLGVVVAFLASLISTKFLR